MELMTSRRGFLGEALGGIVGAAFTTNHVEQQQPTFRTPLCELLGIDYPILQAPMASVVAPKLVAAVGEAGGLGILPGVGLPPDELRSRVRQVRSLTKRPFGVNLLMLEALQNPIDTAALPPDLVQGVQAMLNRFRQRLGLSARSEPPPSVPNTLSASFDVIIEERVPLFSAGLGLPTAAMVKRCHDNGIKVMCMVTTPADAVEAERLGADIIAAQGAEAGGHRSIGMKPDSPDAVAIGTIALLPQVTRAVKVPVIAAGGISNGQGLAAAVVLGAVGVLVGTRFIASAESAAPAFHKQAIVEGESNQTTLSDAFTGLYARFLRNDYIKEYRESGAPVLPPVVQQLASSDITEAAGRQGVAALYPLYAGQGVGMIDTVPAAGDIVRAMITEAREALGSVAQRVRA